MQQGKMEKNARHKLDEIIEMFKKKLSLPDVHVNKLTIKTCVLYNKPLVFKPAGEKLYPMFDGEPQFVAIIKT